MKTEITIIRTQPKPKVRKPEKKERPWYEGMNEYQTTDEVGAGYWIISEAGYPKFIYTKEKK